MALAKTLEKLLTLLLLAFASVILLVGCNPKINVEVTDNDIQPNITIAEPPKNITVRYSPRLLSIYLNQKEFSLNDTMRANIVGLMNYFTVISCEKSNWEMYMKTESVWQNVSQWQDDIRFCGDYCDNNIIIPKKACRSICSPPICTRFNFTDFSLWNIRLHRYGYGFCEKRNDYFAFLLFPDTGLYKLTYTYYYDLNCTKPEIAEINVTINY